MEELHTQHNDNERFILSFKPLLRRIIGYYKLPEPNVALPPAFDDLPPNTDLLVRSDEQPAIELLGFDSTILENLLLKNPEDSDSI